MCATTGSTFFLGKCLSAHLYKSVAGIYQSYCVALRSMFGFGGSTSSPSSILNDALSLSDSSEAASLTGEFTVDVNCFFCGALDTAVTAALAADLGLVFFAIMSH